MAVNFTNNFKNILDKLRNTIRTEFKGALPVYIGHETNQAGAQFLRLDPVGSELLEYMASAELRESCWNSLYYFVFVSRSSSNCFEVYFTFFQFE